MGAAANSAADRPILSGARRRLLTIVALATVCAAGCAGIGQTYVYVDSIAAPGSENLKDYYLLSEYRRRSGGVADVEAGSAYAQNRHRKFIGLVNEALQSQGYTQVDVPDKAQLIVTLQYGIDVRRGKVNSQRTSSVRIVAFDWAAVRDLDHRNAVWHTSAWMDNSSGGLGRVVPIMIGAAGRYLGSNTRGTVEVAVPRQ